MISSKEVRKWCKTVDCVECVSPKGGSGQVSAGSKQVSRHVYRRLS